MPVTDPPVMESEATVWLYEPMLKVPPLMLSAPVVDRRLLPPSASVPALRPVPPVAVLTAVSVRLPRPALVKPSRAVLPLDITPL